MHPVHGRKDKGYGSYKGMGIPSLAPSRSPSALSLQRSQEHNITLIDSRLFRHRSGNTLLWRRLVAPIRHIGQNFKTGNSPIIVSKGRRTKKKGEVISTTYASFHPSMQHQ